MSGSSWDEPETYEGMTPPHAHEGKQHHPYSLQGAYKTPCEANIN